MTTVEEVMGRNSNVKFFRLAFIESQSMFIDSFSFFKSMQNSSFPQLK